MAFSRSITTTHTKTLISPSTGVEDKVYGADYVSASSHTSSGAVVDATSGGIPYFSSTTTEASSALLAANAVMIGGGAGAAPATIAALGTSGWVLTSQGAGQPPVFAAPAAGAVTLDGITAATADQAGIANADWNVRWNWQKTTNSEVAFEIGESAASTNGTSTSGVPNQVIAKFSTVAASTASPLSVYSRASHVFSVSPTTAQIFAADGGTTPTYSFAGSNNMGMSKNGNDLYLSVGGSAKLSLRTNDVLLGDSAAGFAWAANETILTAVGNAGEHARFGRGFYRGSYAADDTTSYAINIRKARGTVASPTVITTGDDLATIAGFGYVGATGTYVEGCRITFDSTGTIANTTSGLGGIMRLSAAVVGTVGPNEIAQVNGTEQHFLHVGTAPTITAGGGTSPSIAGTDEAFTITVGTGGTATSVEVTFAKAFSVAPRCSSNHEGAVLVTRCVSTTTTVTIDAATPFTASGKITVICRSGTT